MLKTCKINLNLEENSMICDFKNDAVIDKHHEIEIYRDYDLLKISKLEVLLERAKIGDSSAAEEICRRFNGMVVNICRSIYINGYTMEDMLQEGRVSLIKSINSYDLNSKYPFPAYAKGAVTKNFYYQIRSNVKKISCCSIYSSNAEGKLFIDMIPSNENIEENFIKNQQQVQLGKAIKRLSPKDKNIIIWYYIKGKNLKEYAVKKKIAYRTAVYRKNRALHNLRKLFKANLWL